VVVKSVSNFLAIATVTATLQSVLQAEIDHEANQPNSVAPAGTVTTFRPDAPASVLPDPGVNLYMYQVTPNTAFRNADLPTRNGDGVVVQRPRAALDLHYLITFYGDERDWQPQRLLGIVARVLHARPVLTRADVLATVTTPALLPALRGSDLADELELVKFTPSPFSLEDLSRLWGVFPETSYTLSAVYAASVVFVEGKEASRQALPVRDRNIYAVPLHYPVVEAVAPQGDPSGPVLATSTLSITGRALQGDITLVRVGGSDVPATQVTEREILLPLALVPPASVRAGMQGLQVVHQLLIGTPEAPHSGVESNVAPVVIRPAFATAGGNPIITPNLAAGAGGLLSGSIDVTLLPEVGKSQRVTLFLNELNPPLGRAPRAYVFDGPARDLPGALDSTASLSFPADHVVPGNYLVRVRVDGADTPLEVDAAGRYVGSATVLP
jgi:hypothetical protein